MALKQRVITALVLAPLVGLVVLFAKTEWFTLVMSVFFLIAAWEWAALSGLNQVEKGCYLLCILSVFCLLYYIMTVGFSGVIGQFFQNIAGLFLLFTVLWWLWALFLVCAYQCGRSFFPYSKTGKLFVGMLVLVPPWFSLFILHGFFTPYIVLYILVLIWVADAAAYFVGRRWGVRRLASLVSPGKTWIGVIAALLSAIFVSESVVYIHSMVMQQQDVLILMRGNGHIGQLTLNIQPWVWVVVSVFVIAGSILGDLFESLLKRVAGKKDSSAILPGHGGMLDRLDSLTSSAPILLCFMYYKYCK